MRGRKSEEPGGRNPVRPGECGVVLRPQKGLGAAVYLGKGPFEQLLR